MDQNITNTVKSDREIIDKTISILTSVSNLSKSMSNRLELLKLDKVVTEHIGKYERKIQVIIINFRI